MMLMDGRPVRRHHRYAAVMCEPHRGGDRWPVAGDFDALIHACAECRGGALRAADLAGSLWLQMFPDLPDDMVEEQFAIHEAAHVVVGVVSGQPLVSVQLVADIAESTDVGGSTTWAPWRGPVSAWMATTWAGQVASLRWLDDVGLDDQADRVDVFYGGHQDLIDIHELAESYEVPVDTGRVLAGTLVAVLWQNVMDVAELLIERRRLEAADVGRLVDPRRWAIGASSS